MNSDIARLTQLAFEDSSKAKPIHRLLGRMNYADGFLAAGRVNHGGEFAQWLYDNVAGLIVPLYVKKAAFDGARESLKLGLSALTEEDISGIERAYFTTFNHARAEDYQVLISN